MGWALNPNLNGRKVLSEKSMHNHVIKDLLVPKLHNPYLTLLFRRICAKMKQFQEETLGFLMFLIPKNRLKHISAAETKENSTTKKIKNNKSVKSSNFILTPGKCLDATTISTGRSQRSRKSCTKAFPVSDTVLNESSDKSDTPNSWRHFLLGRRKIEIQMPKNYSFSL